MVGDAPARGRGGRGRPAGKYCRAGGQWAGDERSGAGVVLHSLSSVPFWGSGQLSLRGLLVSKTFLLVKNRISFVWL